jgi:hypothetical protein
MALVGDIIINAREQFPDRCGTLAAPSGFTAAQLAQVPTLAAGTYLVSITLFTQWGETLPTALSPVVVDGTHGIQVTGTIPVGAVKLRAYYGVGAVNQFQDFTSTPSNITSPGTAGVPPGTAGGALISRAYLPDSDGSFISAATIYRWFNQALDEASDISGGIQDRTGVGSLVGQALYQLPIVGWKKITNVWYDGYDVFSGSKRDVFRRNVTAAYSVLGVAVTLTPNTVIEAFPQPQRTSGTTTLSGNLSATAVTANINAPTGFVLPFGVASITQGSATEIVMYSTVGATTMTGLSRGLGGSVPTAFTTGATIAELNFMIDGYRRAVYANVGDASKTIQVPPSWASLLPIFLLAKFRKAEKEFKEADGLMKEFTEKIKAEAASTKQLLGPVQIGSGNRGPEIRPSGPWGVIVP